MLIIILKLLRKAILLLNSNMAPQEIALGLTLGLCLGLSPFHWFYFLCFILVFIIFRAHWGSGLFMMGLSSLLAYLLFPLFHILGKFILLYPALKPFWTVLYHAPLVPLTHFYNTVMCGSMLVSLMVAFPFYLFSKRLIIRYRNQNTFKNNKIVKSILMSKWFLWAQKIWRLAA